MPLCNVLIPGVLGPEDFACEALFRYTVRYLSEERLTTIGIEQADSPRIEFPKDVAKRPQSSTRSRESAEWIRRFLLRDELLNREPFYMPQEAIILV